MVHKSQFLIRSPKSNIQNLASRLIIRILSTYSHATEPNLIYSIWCIYAAITHIELTLIDFLNRRTNRSRIVLLLPKISNRENPTRTMNEWASSSDYVSAFENIYLIFDEARNNLARS